MSGHTIPANFFINQNNDFPPTSSDGDNIKGAFPIGQVQAEENCQTNISQAVDEKYSKLVLQLGTAKTPQAKVQILRKAINIAEQSGSDSSKFPCLDILRGQLNQLEKTLPQSSEAPVVPIKPSPEEIRDKVPQKPRSNVIDKEYFRWLQYAAKSSDDFVKIHALRQAIEVAETSERKEEFFPGLKVLRKELSNLETEIEDESTKVSFELKAYDAKVKMIGSKFSQLENFNFEIATDQTIRERRQDLLSIAEDVRNIEALMASNYLQEEIRGDGIYSNLNGGAIQIKAWLSGSNNSGTNLKNNSKRALLHKKIKEDSPRLNKQLLSLKSRLSIELGLLAVTEKMSHYGDKAESYRYTNLDQFKRDTHEIRKKIAISGLGKEHPYHAQVISLETKFAQIDKKEAVQIAQVN